ncbi:hypothetical protein [Paludisphaera borealis]|uniref:Uncharacterized protein n=1 Tax=Paludisphaera borealis TaxID=1387353 RepID=A0A1U7CX24_9BACT|nr:hypothetical protein [Paludisphaera borealis]APW63502.1 hypothetical protein BSF38_05074 [Paludisphaera borealis]
MNLVPEGAGGFMGYSEFYSAVPEGQRNQSAQYTYSSLGTQAGSLSTPNLPQPSRTADGSWIYAYNQAGDTTGWDSQRHTYVNIGGVRMQKHRDFRRHQLAIVPLFGWSAQADRRPRRREQYRPRNQRLWRCRRLV